MDEPSSEYWQAVAEERDKIRQVVHDPNIDPVIRQAGRDILASGSER